MGGDQEKEKCIYAYLSHSRPTSIVCHTLIFLLSSSLSFQFSLVYKLSGETKHNSYMSEPPSK